MATSPLSDRQITVSWRYPLAENQGLDGELLDSVVPDARSIIRPYSQGLRTLGHRDR